MSSRWPLVQDGASTCWTRSPLRHPGLSWVRLGFILPDVWKKGVLTLARVGVGVERWDTERSAENDRLLSSDGLQRLQAERRGGKGKTAVGRDPPAARMAPEQLPQGSCETVRRRWPVALGRPVADQRSWISLLISGFLKRWCLMKRTCP